MKRLILVTCRTTAVVLCFSHAMSVRAQNAQLDAFVFDKCPTAVAPPKTVSLTLAALIEPLGERLISNFIDAAGAYLTSAAQTKDASMNAAPVEGYFYSLSEDGHLDLAKSKGSCLVLLSSGKGEHRPSPVWFSAAKNAAPQIAGYSSAPRFYFEAEMIPESVEGANRLRITPRFLHIGDFLADGWSYRNERKYAIGLTFRDRVTGAPFGSAKFEWADLGTETLAVTDVVSGGQNDGSVTVRPVLAAPASVPFYPIEGKVSATALEQQLIAAPYKEATRLLSGKGAPPAHRTADWELKTGAPSVSPSDVDNYQATLVAFCASITAVNKGRKEDKALSDPRCPVDHLAKANKVEEAKSALQSRLDIDWAKAFFNFHTKDGVCKAAFSANPATCTPPAPKAPAQGPYAIEATVVETRDPTEFAKALASAFSANNEKYKTAIEDRLIPSRRAAVQAKDAQTGSDASVAYKLAILAVDQAQAKLDEAIAQPRSAQVPLQMDLLKAKVAANAAARAANLPPPFDI